MAQLEYTHIEVAQRTKKIEVQFRISGESIQNIPYGTCIVKRKNQIVIRQLHLGCIRNSNHIYKI